ncbi:GNAT family N-acetyltransferase [Paenibacillus chondroitinus]|uniref:GNAT family N-acetyltransferase n=1 Tax=Paenibacillus chondroitinus TaxID=59842 RepID=A0ABU6DDI9_9BACL|nr:MULTISPECIES: GNAT family N-acetyltransferase [Paenibacillus]MCY9659927.1 GNAT family N-acetyltransferase [Paenibacillus anseongense]MEB4795455.1 GNAT family N-acetyltransferase [Paenibacillus chondroitinus]
MEIVQLTGKDGNNLLALYRAVAADLKRQNIRQWDWLYPNGFVIRGDLRRGTAFGVRIGSRIIGAIVVDDRQSKRYEGLPWVDHAVDRVRCIHRLAVDPTCQGQGIGGKLLRFAEEQALLSGGTSIRLDVYSGNSGAAKLYARGGYRQVGQIRFPLRKEEYICYEKLLG